MTDRSKKLIDAFKAVQSRNIRSMRVLYDSFYTFPRQRRFAKRRNDPQNKNPPEKS